VIAAPVRQEPVASVETPTPTVPPASPSSLGDAPNGLLAVKGIAHPEGLDPRTVNNPFIRGFAIQIAWRDLEPEQGKPDWSRLEELFAAAEGAKKWVRLVIYAGFWTPGWALEGVRWEQFARQYGPGRGTVEKLPMPWDGVYLARWIAFLREVHAKFGTSPAFRMIAAAGPTSVSAEMTLPRRPQDLAAWKRNSYTPQRYTEAWRRVLQAYAAEFPDQYVSLSVGDGIPINDDGRSDPSEPTRTRQAVVEQAFGILGHRFVLMNDDLHAGPEQHEATEFVRNASGRMITGLEMRCPATVGTCSAAMGADGDPPNALRKSMTLGSQPGSTGRHVDFFEIYEPDVLGDEMQPVLREGSSLLDGRR
jgi:hypothetical protein